MSKESMPILIDIIVSEDSEVLTANHTSSAVSTKLVNDNELFLSTSNDGSASRADLRSKSLDNNIRLSIDTDTDTDTNSDFKISVNEVLETPSNVSRVVVEAGTVKIIIRKNPE